jgi:hypothetical protein
MKISTFFGVVSDPKAVRSYQAHHRLASKPLGAKGSLERQKTLYHCDCCAEIGRKNRVLTNDEKRAFAASNHLPMKGGR